MVEQTIIYCKDLKYLISYVKVRRNFTVDHLKLGINGGSGFLKVCFSIQSSNDNDNNVHDDDDGIVVSKSKHRKFKDSIEDETFKDSSVKKLFIIAIAPDAQENTKMCVKCGI